MEKIFGKMPIISKELDEELEKQARPEYGQPIPEKFEEELDKLSLEDLERIMKPKRDKHPQHPDEEINGNDAEEYRKAVEEHGKEYNAEIDELNKEIGSMK